MIKIMRVSWKEGEGGLVHYSKERVRQGTPAVPIPMACGKWPKAGEDADVVLWPLFCTWEQILRAHEKMGDRICEMCWASVQLQELIA